MSEVSIDIGRITLALHGISALIAEEAMDGLELELRRRLGAWPFGDLQQLDLGVLSLPVVDSEVVLDPAALRGIIAERLAQALMAAGPPAGGGGV